MNCSIQQNAFAARDEMRGPLICPKPRRIGQLSGVSGPIRSLRWQSCQQVDPSDLKAGVELLDLFLTKGGEFPVDSTPPFFCGSPPTRSANPLVNDARFGEAAPVNLLPLPNPSPIPLSSPVPIPAPAAATARTGCARTKFGFAPAAVRTEGFDCLDRGCSRSRGIPAVA